MAAEARIQYKIARSIFGNLFIQRATLLEITPGSSSDKQSQMTRHSNVQVHRYTTNTVTVWRMMRGKVCRTVISLPTHAHPVSDSDFLVFSVCVSVFMQLCERENKSECVPDTETLVFSAQAADLSTIISWIVLHAQHLSQTHTNCLFHTHKHSHYILITVRLMLYSPL